MSVIEELLSAQPPDELFHYTSPEGLLGIITSGELWASKAIFMNDTAEFRLALELARDEIQNRSLSEALEQEFLADVDSIEKVNVFICSFSAEDDLLSQWRGYCPPGAGYALGFTPKYLEETAKRSGLFYLGKCTYEHVEHVAVIRELVGAALARKSAAGGAEELGSPSDDQRHPLWDRSFQDALAFAAPLLKHTTFSEEKEWRLISKPVDYDHPALSHRPGKTHLLPYFRVPLSSDPSEQPISLRRLVIGPTPHPELADDAIFSLFGAYGLRDCKVARSEIPFRAW
jgi:hypothetical protein